MKNLSSEERPEPSSSKNPSRIASSVHDINAEKPPFGSRFLTDDADVWSQNAWDHVPPPKDHGLIINAALEKQRTSRVAESDRTKYNEKPSRHWDNFYKMNSSNFFRNRKWLHLEFLELVEAAKPDAGPLSIVEVGCGAGNAVFPLLSANQNPLLALHAFDYSSHAVKLVQNNPLYLSPPCGSIHSAVWDLSSSSLPPGVEPGSVDAIILVFVLSALHPDEWRQAISNMHRMLKPGGLVLFRDYGRYDLTQLRFKSGRMLEENFYIRGDKTRVYFFELDELALLFSGSRARPVTKDEDELQVVEDTEYDLLENARSSSPSFRTAATSNTSTEDIATVSLSELRIETSAAEAFPSAGNEEEHPVSSETPIVIHPSLLSASLTPEVLPLAPFKIEQLGVDRRLIVNRKRQLKMYRVWVQGKFRKIEGP